MSYDLKWCLFGLERTTLFKVWVASRKFIRKELLLLRICDIIVVYQCHCILPWPFSRLLIRAKIRQMGDVRTQIAIEYYYKRVPCASQENWTRRSYKIIFQGYCRRYFLIGQKVHSMTFKFLLNFKTAATFYKIKSKGDVVELLVNNMPWKWILINSI